jgi:hypothetical protein
MFGGNELGDISNVIGSVSDASSSAVDSMSGASNSISTYLQDGMESFINTFTMRTIGTIAGQIVAAAFLKFLSDQVFAKLNQKNKKDTSFNSKPTTKTSETEEIPLSAWFTLAACIVIDGIGDSSFLLPGIGEIEDVVWAPLSAYILSALFGSNVVAGIDFMKEILPGSDIIPVAITAWIIKYKFPKSPVASALGLKPAEAIKPPDVTQFFSLLSSKVKESKSKKKKK